MLSGVWCGHRSGRGAVIHDVSIGPWSESSSEGEACPRSKWSLGSPCGQCASTGRRQRAGSATAQEARAGKGLPFGPALAAPQGELLHGRRRRQEENNRRGQGDQEEDDPFQEALRGRLTGKKG
jgi:hypothetical protein